MEELQNTILGEKKRGGHILYDFIYRKILNININKETYRLVVSLKLGGEMGETAQGVEFYFQVMELFWKSINKKW